MVWMQEDGSTPVSEGLGQELKLLDEDYNKSRVAAIDKYDAENPNDTLNDASKNGEEGTILISTSYLPFFIFFSSADLIFLNDKPQ